MNRDSMIERLQDEEFEILVQPPLAKSRFMDYLHTERTSP